MSAIDELAAVRVKFYTTVDAPEQWRCDSKGLKGAAWKTLKGDVICKKCQGCGNPSTDIDQALDLLRIPGPESFYLSAHYIPPAHFYISAVRKDGSKISLTHKADANTLPLAVTLLALRMCGTAEREIGEALLIDNLKNSSVVSPSAAPSGQIDP